MNTNDILIQNISDKKNHHDKNKIKVLILITIFSVIPCGLYSLMLCSSYNSYLYTSFAKLILFLAFPLICFSLTKHAKIIDIIKPSGEKNILKASGILGGACALLIIIGFIVMGKLFDNKQIIGGLSNQGITKAIYPLVFIHIVFVNAFLEEIFFRGFIFLTIYKLGYRSYAYIYSSILFSLYHLAMINTWFSPFMFGLCMVGLVGAGLIFNEVDRQCNSIYGSYFIHLGANIGINLIGAYLFTIAH